MNEFSQGTFIPLKEYITCIKKHQVNLEKQFRFFRKIYWNDKKYKNQEMILVRKQNPKTRKAGSYEWLNMPSENILNIMIVGDEQDKHKQTRWTKCVLTTKQHSFVIYYLYYEPWLLKELSKCSEA